MLTFDLYSRRGCHLCELMIEALLPILGGQAKLEIHDVDRCEKWRTRYGSDVPVLEIAGERLCRFKLDDSAIDAIRDRIANKPS